MPGLWAISSWGTCEGASGCFLSLSFSLPLPLKINKIFKNNKTTIIITYYNKSECGLFPLPVIFIFSVQTHFWMCHCRLPAVKDLVSLVPGHPLLNFPSSHHAFLCSTMPLFGTHLLFNSSTTLLIPFPSWLSPYHVLCPWFWSLRCYSKTSMNYFFLHRIRTNFVVTVDLSNLGIRFFLLGGEFHLFPYRKTYGFGVIWIVSILHFGIIIK